MKFDPRMLTLQDDYIFGEVMSDPQICLKLIRLVLPRVDIKDVKFVERQKTIKEQKDSHGVRLDIYARDNQQNTYNIEMQVRNVKGLRQRVRYYHSQMDIDNFNEGQEYEALPGSCVIFICVFDPFGLGLHRYEFNHLCLADSSLHLDDGQRVVFLNTKGIVDDVDSGLANFLKFVDNKEVEDEFMDEIKERMVKISSNEEWRRKYMNNKQHMYFHDQDLREETRQKDKEEFVAALKKIFQWQAEGLSQQEVRERLRTELSFTDDDIQQVFS